MNRVIAFICIWEYRVRPDRLDEYERAYGPEGEWATLFRRAPGFVRTELHRDRDDPLRFITIDCWETQAAWERFRADDAAEYEALDARCAALTTSEREIGRFSAVA